ncbi:hypothetical protein ACFL6G_07315 [candidate division KSB1 bacterium]
MNTKTLFTAILLLFLFSIPNCTDSPETYTEEIIDGVRHVHNISPLWGDEERIKLEFVQKIGDMDESEANYYFKMIMDAVEDSKGNIMVFEFNNRRIRKYDSIGNFLSATGDYFPDKTLIPSSMDIDRNDRLYLISWSKSIHVFDQGGNKIRAVPIPVTTSQFRIMNSGNIVCRKNDLDTKSENLLFIINMTGEILENFGEVKIFEAFQDITEANRLSFELDEDDNILVSFNHQNRVEKYSPDGILLWTLDRPLKYELIKYIDVKSVQNGKEVIHTFPRFSDVSGSIGVDYKGRTWNIFYIKQFEKGDDYNQVLEFQIFDNNGILLAKVPLPDTGNVSTTFRIFGDNLYFISDNCIYKYKIVE